MKHCCANVYGKWIFLVIFGPNPHWTSVKTPTRTKPSYPGTPPYSHLWNMDLVILTYSTPGRFYHESHTSDKYTWGHADWPQNWQQDWFSTTARATRRTKSTTVTSRAELLSTPTPTPPQPTIRDVDIRVAETTTLRPTENQSPVQPIISNLETRLNETTTPEAPTFSSTRDVNVEFQTVSSDFKKGYFSKIDAVLANIQGTDSVFATPDGSNDVPLLDAKASLWHVVIYERKGGRYEHICGGSLLKADVVISAGHCFWSPVWQNLPITSFKVAAGKLYPRYDDPRDTSAQYSDIKNISITDMVEPCLQPDLAYMHLATPFMYTSAVKPVCFNQDWDRKGNLVGEGKLATVASWSVLEGGDCRPSQHSWLSLPFIKNKDCQHEVNFKTGGSDRICAGEINNTTQCATDSGNGLIFYYNSIPYLRGVATNLPIHELCSRFYTRSFSNIIDTAHIYRDFFKGISNSLNAGECENFYRNVTNEETQKNGTDNGFGEGFIPIEPPQPAEEPDFFTATGIGSSPVPTLSDTSAPAFQWHVGVYSKVWDPYMQVCGGSLVKRDTVISAAHCFWSDETGSLPASQFAVAGGKMFRPWNSTQDAYAQHSDVSEIILPVRFRGSATSFQDDIAVLRLATPFTYAPGVQSVCIDFDRQFEKQQLQPGYLGTVLGWGLTEANGNPSQRLTYLELPYVDVEDCFADSEPAFIKYITSDKICAGDTTSGKALCRGDSGGGLVLYAAEIPYLHGVASTAAGNENLCNAFAIAAFTSLYSHRAFLRDNIPDIDKECAKPSTGNIGTGTERDGTGNVGIGGTVEAVPVVTNTNVPYFPYPNHFVCNCNCKP